jgi:hypothetical protein
MSFRDNLKIIDRLKRQYLDKKDTALTEKTEIKGEKTAYRVI